MTVIPIQSLDDPRVAPYRDLRDKELARDGQRFIAEGEHLARRLLTSDFPVESVLCSDKRLPRLSPYIPAEVPVYLVSEELLSAVAGYKFHTGAMAIGRRKPSPRIDSLFSSGAKRTTIVVCPKILNTHNLGSIIRVTAALGADGLVLGPLCCDPFYRKSVRISMGAAFKLPIVQCEDLERDLVRMRDEFGVQLIATALVPGAEELQNARRGTHPAQAGGTAWTDRVAIVLGPEDTGLDESTLALCTRTVMIPMRHGVDSLNVAMCGAIVLQHFINV